MSLPRILVLSDLHLEMHDYVPQADGYDLAVLAGDIHTKNRGVAWALKHFSVPVVYVRGNHEGYGGHWQRGLEKMRAMAAGTNVHILEHDTVELLGVRFVGATGWTTFELWPDPLLAMTEAGMGRDPHMNGARDYRFIRTGPDGVYRKLRPSDTAAWARQTRRWLHTTLAEPSALPTVVVTHHPPSARSLEHGVREPLDATDANPWDDVVEASGAALWLHGHTHHPVDYMIGRTRMFSNPRGYPGQEIAHRRDGIVVPTPMAVVGGPRVA